MTTTIEQLKRIVADQAKTEEERRNAAELILKLQAKDVPAPVVTDVLAVLNGMLADIGGTEDRRVAAENAAKKACPDCFHCQPVDHDTCQLCGIAPDTWLEALVRRPRRNHQGDVVDQNGVVIASGTAAYAQCRGVEADNFRRWAATEAAVADLQIIVSRGAGVDWELKHAARILRLRGADVPLSIFGQQL